MKKRKFIGRFLTANLKGDIFDDNVRRAVIINLFSIVGFLSLTYFLVKGIMDQRWIYSIIMFVFWGLTFATLLLFQKFKNCQFASIVIVTLMFFLEIALLLKLGESITGMFWVYLFPLLSFFMLGNKIGTYFTIALLVIGVIIIKLPIKGITQYPNELHERFIFIYIVTSLLAYIFEYIRKITFDAFILSDKQKSEYLEETLQQKEEIQTQAELLSRKNIELKQLSLVASETDNSIIITDSKGKIEWVNKSFENLYGYNAEEYQEKCGNIFNCSKEKTLLIKSKTEKRTVKFPNEITDKKGRKIWLQTTATPILDKKENLINIILIESDITPLKKAEAKILEKNKELEQQRDEILSQKDVLLDKNEIILQKNYAINQSIKYALTIQKSILPNLSDFNKKFRNFLVYKPKDIVSGDFFWLSKIKNNNYIIAVVDCTGHGVPGAFMSILGSRMLDEIVVLQKIYSPAKILDKLNQKVIKTLEQKNIENIDGMDIILCNIVVNNNLDISFCGAKRPLYYSEDCKKIEKIKGVRKSIGGIKSGYNKSKFKNVNISLKKDAIIYLTSDGYIDQHNNKRKRIGTKRFLQVLSRNCQKNLTEQKQNLVQYLNNWQNKEMQTDDITIWAIKL